LAVVAVVLIARTVFYDGPARRRVSVRSEVIALRSPRLWLVLAALARVPAGYQGMTDRKSPKVLVKP
jgi:hypothetical protein